MTTQPQETPRSDEVTIYSMGGNGELMWAEYADGRNNIPDSTEIAVALMDVRGIHEGGELLGASDVKRLLGTYSMLLTNSSGSLPRTRRRGDLGDSVKQVKAGRE